MNPNDVFPPRNLPAPAVQWGRDMEARIKRLQVAALGSAEELKNSNRTTAAVTSELARQLKKLEEFLDELEDLLSELQGILDELERLYRAIPKTQQVSNTTTNFPSSVNWYTVNSITISFPAGSDHVEISAFGNGAMKWAAGERDATLQGRMLIRNGSGPYVTADQLGVARGRMAVLTPQNTRSLDGTQDFTVEFQVRATDSSAYQSETDNYASLTVLATFTGVN